MACDLRIAIPLPRLLVPSLLSVVFIALSTGASYAQASHTNENGDFSTGPTLPLDRWTGDLDGILERKLLRVGTVYSPIFFFYDGPEGRGIAVDSSVELQKHLQEQLGKSAKDLSVIVVPLARDGLISALVDGRVDVLMANLTITPERSALIDFSSPIQSGVRELIVTGPSLSHVETIDDLVPIGVHVRRSSSYRESVEYLNSERVSNGLKEIPIHEADERLEDYDLLEMVAAGAIPAIIVDSHKALLWSQVFQEIKVQEDLAFREDGETALAVRLDSPNLLKAVNGFVEVAKKGTLLGNVLFERYYGDKERIVNALQAQASEEQIKAFELIRKHSAVYGFDPLIVLAQAFQESRLDQSKVSPAGAVGIMQILPKTAEDPNVDISDIHLADNNIEAGVKYLEFIRNRYFSEADISKEDAVFLSLAAYNAGPRKMAKARSEAQAMDLDPNVWFNNVEIASSRVISREPAVYVRNILKYYSQYKAFDDLTVKSPSND